MRRSAFLGAAIALAILVAPSRGAAPASPARLDSLPVCRAADLATPEGDWLVAPVKQRAVVARSEDGKEIVLHNGLIARTFRIAPNAATVGFDNVMTGQAILRGVKPEARLQIDGVPLAVGGLVGQPEYAYLQRAWLDTMTSDPAAMQFAGFEVGEPVAPLEWKRKRYCPDAAWPPKGVALVLRFVPPAGQWEGLSVAVRYELYDGIPLLCKSLSVTNGGAKPVRLEAFTSEILAAVEPQSDVESPGRWEYPNIHVETDYAFLGMSAAGANKTAHWVADPDYASQVNYLRETPALLEVRPPLGPDAEIAPGATFQTFRVYELVFDSTDRERKGLAQRRMYRTIAPWTQENPILMHVRHADPAAVRLAVDQCAEVGFEMLILSFGSGFNMENETPAYLAQIQELADYAHAKGVELGGYSLLASRSVGPDDDAINPATGKPGGMAFGNSPCLGSRWGDDYFRKLYAFIEKTGIDILEHDGSYPGDVCASTSHPGHRGLADSQWNQWRRITDFYKWCRARGVYLNVPDWYFLSGSNKTGMGYRETNWSLPRDRQILLGRQNIFDGTWGKTPSMGWMFVPLVEYHGGGAAATLEPLSEHRDAYGAHLAQNFGSGVQACYRGPRLFDTPETKAVVQQWVRFYKEHRQILDSDILHIRRADGRRPDCLLHVNPAARERALAVVFNPLDRPVETTLRLPLYYAGLTDSAMVRHEEGNPERVPLDREYRAAVPVVLPPHGMTWLVFENP